MNRYPEGGGMVGVANPDIYEASKAPKSGESSISPELAKAMMSKIKAPVSSVVPASSAAPATKGGLYSSMAGSGGGGSSWMSAASKAGPWAALAAAIIANESKQSGDGNRGNSAGEHVGDFLTGKALERDAERYLPHNKAGGIVKRNMMMSTPSGIVRNAKDLGGWIKGLF